MEAAAIELRAIEDANNAENLAQKFGLRWCERDALRLVADVYETLASIYTACDEPEMRTEHTADAATYLLRAERLTEALLGA